MKSKTWLILFLITILVVLGMLAALNALVDPFGLFGDPVFDWYAYNISRNQRMAKVAYLDRYHDRYDSYLLGTSVAGSIPVELLNQYTGARFYNLFGNGADMHRTRILAEYIVEHYTVKNIVLVVSITDAKSYEVDPAGRLSSYLPARVDGSSAAAQYARYLLADPKHALDKISYAQQVTYLPKSFNAYYPERGERNRTWQDFEPIGGKTAYKKKHSDFSKKRPSAPVLEHLDDCVGEVAAIASLCRENDINLLVVFPPNYTASLRATPTKERATFLRKLAGVTDYWDFSHSSLSGDPRYFYDVGHFRGPLVNVMLARIFGDNSLYIPDDFGVLVTADNAKAHTKRLDELLVRGDYETKLHVLSFALPADGDMSDFEAKIAALRAVGCQSVTFAQVAAYVTRGAPLPENPVVITFAGGYLEAGSPAFGILEHYGMEASTFITGDGLGDGLSAGLGAAAEDGDEMAYIEAFRSDFARLRDAWAQATGDTEPVYAYPPRGVSLRQEVLLSEMGVRITLVPSEALSRTTVVWSLPQSLLQLPYFTVGADMDDGWMEGLP
ncbi:MAG: hypothetical protein FWE59_03400 [Oscillospiraceae bacterium]|nr:hypothetical protein [Oscillospiraceae bacterium]